MTLQPLLNSNNESDIALIGTMRAGGSKSNRTKKRVAQGAITGSGRGVDAGIRASHAGDN